MPARTVVNFKDVLTTGDVAKICNVASRTVVRWFDSGALNGYRIPCSQDRRFLRKDVIDFLRANKMPLGVLGVDVDIPNRSMGDIINNISNFVNSDKYDNSLLRSDCAKLIDAYKALEIGLSSSATC